MRSAPFLLPLLLLPLADSAQAQQYIIGGIVRYQFSQPISNVIMRAKHPVTLETWATDTTDMNGGYELRFTPTSAPIREEPPESYKLGNAWPTPAKPGETRPMNLEATKQQTATYELFRFS